LLIAIVLSSAALHAAWNALIHHAPREASSRSAGVRPSFGTLKRERDPRAASVLVMAGAAFVSAVLALTIGPSSMPQAAWPSVLVAGAVEAAYFVALGGALQRLPLQTAYGVSRGLGVLLVWPLSVWLTGEHASAVHISGAIVLAVGLGSLVERRREGAALGWAIAAAVTVAAYPVAYKRALDAGAAPFSLFALSLTIGLPATVAALGRDAPLRLLSAARASGGRLAFAALMCAASFLLVLVALETLGAGRVTALRNTSVLFASIYGWMAGEEMSARTVGAALLMALGAVLVTV
jgi:drug/metabolite transporter (DMT)-like permease